MFFYKYLLVLEGISIRKCCGVAAEERHSARSDALADALAETCGDQTGRDHAAFLEAVRAGRIEVEAEW